MKILCGSVAALLIVVSVNGQTPNETASCTQLAALTLPYTAITVAQSVTAGAFTAPAGSAAPSAAFKTLPPFCRVAATVKPTNESDIKVEVWLPATGGWNGKFQAVGNGGWGGSINYSDMANALQAGYASASTDTGHSGNSGTFALDREKLIDFAWRSEHEMTVKAKGIIQARYGRAPTFSYWNGCSGGGRQGLKEAQNFPDDYDGIIAGAPGNRTALPFWIAAAVLRDPASYIPPSKYPIIHQAAIAACDSRDGLNDGLIDDPTQCDFDPGVLLCKAADNPSCLTHAQSDAARKIYSPAINPRTGQELFSSMVPGTELGWGGLATGPEPSANTYEHFRYIVFKDPKWDWRTFDFDRDAARAEMPENAVINATDPNLKPYFSHGGKLLLYQGWSDPTVPALNTIRYYKNVVETVGGTASASESIRLFMAPGMGHCGGGEGPDVFDKIGALERWVEQGKAPEKMIASRIAGATVQRTRLLCPYPQVARYDGTGSVDAAANFVCRAP